MFRKNKEVKPLAEQRKEKPTPAFLRPDYPFKAVGEAIIDLNLLEDGTMYEIKCRQCEMSIRSQGQNIRKTWDRLKESGCIGCGNKELKVYKVDMRKAVSER